MSYFLLKNPQIKRILTEKLISRARNLLFMPTHLPTKGNVKNYIKLSLIWDQSRICSSNRLAMRASQKKTVTATRSINMHQLRLLIFLQIGAVDKLLDLDQWNFNTKNIKHSTLSCSAQEEQVWKIISRKILNLSLNAKFCIFKNMAPFLYVFRTGPCF